MKINKKLFLKIVKKAKSVAVIGHQSPDGDCLGSVSAIYFLCKKYKKITDAFIDDEISSKYKCLNFSYIKSESIDLLKYDLVISVDVASAKLLGKYKQQFYNHKNTIVIDHHSNRDLYGTTNIIDEKKASCCQIIYEIIQGCKLKIDKNLATLLYLGIADDTGCFVHDNTDSQSHLITSKLFKLGADFKKINYYVFKLVSAKSFEIKKKIYNLIQFNYGIRYVVLTLSYMKKNNFTKHDLGDFVNELLNLEGSKISFLMTEKQSGVFSLSFRCIDSYDVSKIAQIFNGGGHKEASGGEVRGNVDDCIKKVINECIKEIRRKENGGKNVWKKWIDCFE